MDENTIRFYKKLPFAVRLVPDEIKFIDENFEELFDNDETIPPRKAFMMLVEKALYNVKMKKNIDHNPEDLSKIKDLEQTINSLKDELTLKDQDVLTVSSDLNNVNDQLRNQLNEAVQTIEELKKNPLEKQKELSENEVLLQLVPSEKWLLDQLIKIHDTNAKDLLINRFLMVYQKRGNGDFNIKRIRPEIFEKVMKELS